MKISSKLMKKLVSLLIFSFVLVGCQVTGTFKPRSKPVVGKHRNKSIYRSIPIGPVHGGAKSSKGFLKPRFSQNPYGHSGKNPKWNSRRVHGGSKNSSYASQRIYGGSKNPSYSSSGVHGGSKNPKSISRKVYGGRKVSRNNACEPGSNSYGKNTNCYKKPVRSLKPKTERRPLEPKKPLQRPTGQYGGSKTYVTAPTIY